MIIDGMSGVELYNMARQVAFSRTNGGHPPSWMANTEAWRGKAVAALGEGIVETAIAVAEKHPFTVDRQLMADQVMLRCVCGWKHCVQLYELKDGVSEQDEVQLQLALHLAKQAQEEHENA